MTGEFAIKKVALDVLAHLERRRHAIASDEQATAHEVDVVLEPARNAYRESELPSAYFEALEQEIKTGLPAAWRAVAVPFTALEARSFGIWRGGDLGARLVYVLSGLALGGLVIWLPFIPIWEKWLPFALAASGWWLPDAQVAWHRRRYARELGSIARRLGTSQAALEATVTVNALVPPDKTS